MFKRVFDVHVHFARSESEYEDSIRGLLKYAEDCKVRKIALLGSPDANHLVERAIREYSDLFIGLAWVNLDKDVPEVVEWYASLGFKGIKVILTEKNYDDPSYFPFYDRAEKNRMVILFHTGVIGGPVDYLVENVDPFEEVSSSPFAKFLKGKSSARMRSIYLDTIAHTFPKLRIIGAHLGWPEYQVSCAVARWRRFVFFDISGGEVVRRHILEGGYIRKDISPRKLIFGTDSALEKMYTEVYGWYDALRSIGLSSEEIDMILYRNAAKLFEVDDEK